jgi:hypothetical protein
MATLKVGRTRRVRATSTASSAHEIDDSMRRSCRGFPARTRTAACGPSRGLPPSLRLAYADSASTKATNEFIEPNAANDAIAANTENALRRLPDACFSRFAYVRDGSPPDIHKNIRRQCEAFLRDFNDCPELVVPQASLSGEMGAAGGSTDSHTAAQNTTDAANPAELNTKWIRKALRTLLAASNASDEIDRPQLQAFCGFLQALIDARPAAQASLVCAFCRSESTVTARAFEFGGNYFNRLQKIPDVAAHSTGDVVFLLLGCLAGKGISEIWSHEAMQALPMTHLAFLNALASAAVKKPNAVKRRAA